MENNKKQVVAPGKEESISLKENNVLATPDNKKKKTNQISLQKLDLGTTPINISSSNNFIDFNLIINLIKTRIKIVLAIIAVIFVLIVLFSLKAILFNKNEEEKTEVKEINIPENNIVASSPSSSIKQNLNSTSSSSSSSKK